MRLTRPPLVVIVALATVLGTPSASFAAPANDDFADAVVVTSAPFTHSADTVGWTTEPAEPHPTCQRIVGGTAWYSYDAPPGLVVTADTLGSDFDTVLAAYTGPALDGLAQRACNDDASGLTSRVRVGSGSGGTIHFQVSGYEGQAGNLTFNLGVMVGPANDAIAGAKPIPSVPYSDAMSTRGATTDPGEPLPCGAMGATVWYRYDATTRGAHAVTTGGSGYDTVLAVYRLAGATLEPLACNDDAGAHLQSLVSFQAQPDTTYYVQAGGWSQAEGDVRLRVTHGARVAQGAPAAVVGAGAAADRDYQEAAIEVGTLTFAGANVRFEDRRLAEATACVFGICR